MTRTTCQISVSLDGFAAGPNQSLDNPLGEGGDRLHEWAFPPEGRGAEPVDAQIHATWSEGVGAFVMGRKMFGGGDGPFDPAWHGWWGEDPPYHAPVYVVTHHAREPLEMQGGTTFHFVTDGIEAALEAACEAAGGRDVAIAGGASTVQQYLAAGLLDELFLHIAPVILGAGERLLDGVGDPRLEPVEVIASPVVTHVRYRVVH
jgi:dihydrofolate reductase